MRTVAKFKESDDVKRETGEYCLKIRKSAQITIKMMDKSKIRRDAGEISILVSS